MSRYQRLRTWLFHIFPSTASRAGYVASTGHPIIGEILSREISPHGRQFHTVCLRTFHDTYLPSGEIQRTSWTRWVLARELAWFPASTKI